MVKGSQRHLSCLRPSRWHILDILFLFNRSWAVSGNSERHSPISVNSWQLRSSLERMDALVWESKHGFVWESVSIECRSQPSKKNVSGTRGSLLSSLATPRSLLKPPFPCSYLITARGFVGEPFSLLWMREIPENSVLPQWSVSWVTEIFKLCHDQDNRQALNSFRFA